MTDVIIILRGYFNFRHVSIGMKFISRRARRDRIVPRTQLRWHLHFHLLGNVVDVSLAYLHRGDERCISRRSWFPIMFHEVAGENWRPKATPLRWRQWFGAGGQVDDSVVHNVTSRNYPVVLPPSVIHSSLSIVAGVTTNLSSSYESHSPFCKDDLYALAYVAHRWTIRCLAIGTIRFSAFSLPLPSTTLIAPSALLARAIFLTALNTALTEIPEHFPTP